MTDTVGRLMVLNNFLLLVLAEHDELRLNVRQLVALESILRLILVLSAFRHIVAFARFFQSLVAALNDDVVAGGSADLI